jgi:hypothetical protein
MKGTCGKSGGGEKRMQSFGGETQSEEIALKT